MPERAKAADGKERGAGSALPTAENAVRPGAVTALLDELARVPEATLGGVWGARLASGTVVGRFEIVQEIGRGGFGVVYEARDLELSRSVAFKAVRAGERASLREEWFRREAEAAAQLNHPNIVQLFDLGRSEDGPYLIMELLRGETLAERQTREPLSAPEALRVAVEVARGVAYAHARGVVHRDLKPSNVFLTEDGQVKVLDFGLARLFGGGGVSGGTPAYMAPEQWRGAEGDERADVFSLGAMFYELLCGKRPFEKGAEEAAAPGAKPAPVLEKVPGRRARLIARMLSLDAADRPRNGTAVHEALAAFERSAIGPRVWVGWAVAAVAAIAGAALALWPRYPLPPGRLLTAMADTENATGDPELDGVGELLRVGLEQSRRVSVMERSRLVNVLREDGSATPKAIGEIEARTAAKKAQAQVLIVPAIRREGPGYDVAVRALDPGRNEPLFAVREVAGGKGSVPNAIDRLTARIRKALHEDPKDIPKTLVSAVEVAPANPEAWRLYVEGQRQFSEGRFKEATKAYQRAIAIAPDFLLPRVAFFDPGWRLLDEPDQDEQLRTLGENIHRLPPRERAYVEMLILRRRAGSHAERLALLDRAIEAWPEDWRPYLFAANENLRRGDVDAARPYMEKHVALAPPHDAVAIDHLIALGRLDDALGRTLRWTEESPNWVSFLNLSAVRRARGEMPQALEAARRAVALNPDHIADHFETFVEADAIDEMEALLARTRLRKYVAPLWLATRGRLREALEIFDAQAPPASAPDALYGVVHVFRSYLMFARGDPAAVYREAEEAFRLGYDSWRCSPWLLALLGDAVRAERVARAQYRHDRNVCWRMYQAVRTWKQGDREAALRAFAGIYHPSSHLYMGEILYELNRDREAVEAFRLYRRLLEPFVLLLGPVILPRSLYLEAAALERLGEREEARKVAGRLLHLWERADPDLPLLREARALGKRLGVTGRRRAPGGEAGLR